jgi:DNA-binding CsgD family transcriptional regulator
LIQQATKGGCSVSNEDERIRVVATERAAHHFQVLLPSGETLLVLSVEDESAALMARLTKSEREVVDLMLQGCSNSEIAQRRKTSVHTTANQIKAVFRKLGCSGRRELATRVSRGLPPTANP